jgi:hypothetical protein
MVKPTRSQKIDAQIEKLTEQIEAHYEEIAKLRSARSLLESKQFSRETKGYSYGDFFTWKGREYEIFSRDRFRLRYSKARTRHYQTSRYLIEFLRGEITNPFGR